jgi:hypothetical protein
MQIGSTIKSYDFNGIMNTYMVGRVVDLMDDFILCDTLEIVWEGVKQPIKESRRQFRTVVQGKMFMDNPAQPRIVVLA